jgi:hypothetical protein
LVREMSSIHQNQSVSFNGYWTLRLCPATSFSIPLPVPAQPARSPIRWDGDGSWWNSASTAIRIDGEDKGGVTEAVGWNGGGGFRYYHLAPSLLQKDEFGNWIISKEYNPAMLAEAMCKLEGFIYVPSDSAYWQHGHSTETDFIYVTTQTLTREQLQKLSDEVGESRSLLVMCGAFRVKNLDEFPNLTVKKIPKAVLTRCEWGHDDYSLEIKNLPIKAPEEGNVRDASATDKKPRSKEERRAGVEQPSLFDTPPEEEEP